MPDIMGQIPKNLLDSQYHKLEYRILMQRASSSLNSNNFRFYRSIMKRIFPIFIWYYKSEDWTSQLPDIYIQSSTKVYILSKIMILLNYQHNLPLQKNLITDINNLNEFLGQQQLFWQEFSLPAMKWDEQMDSDANTLS